jgi:large subunit ribosomal protein L24
MFKLINKKRSRIKIKKDDKVKILIGKDRGKTGKVEKIFPKKRQVLVSGVNIYKKHVKPQGKDKPGGIVEVSMPLDVSNLALVCPKCNKTSRVGCLIDKKGEKHRICKKCKQVV